MLKGNAVLDVEQRIMLKETSVDLRHSNILGLKLNSGKELSAIPRQVEQSSSPVKNTGGLDIDRCSH